MDPAAARALAALMRSLPMGWCASFWHPDSAQALDGSFFVLSVLYASGLFPLLFIAERSAAGRGRGGSLVQSAALVVVISVPLLSTRIHAVQSSRASSARRVSPCWCCASDALKPSLFAMAGAAIMFSAATVLTKRWGRPEGMTSLGVTGWTFLFAGLTLLPVTLIIEGLPDHLTTQCRGSSIRC